MKNSAQQPHRVSCLRPIETGAAHCNVLCNASATSAKSTAPLLTITCNSKRNNRTTPAMVDRRSLLLHVATPGTRTMQQQVRMVGQQGSQMDFAERLLSCKADGLGVLLHVAHPLGCNVQQRG